MGLEKRVERLEEKTALASDEVEADVTMLVKGNRVIEMTREEWLAWRREHHHAWGES